MLRQRGFLLYYLLEMLFDFLENMTSNGVLIIFSLIDFGNVPVKPIEEKIRLSKHKLVKVGPRDNRNDGATSKGIEVFRELTYTAQEKKRKYIAGSPKSSK